MRFPFPIATGWFAVAWSDELQPGDVRAIPYFARELVLFRTERGTPHLLDAFCPHLGAHLGGGRVEGQDLVCPFHGWRWSGKGRCTGIPYATRIPPQARIPCWPVVEHSQAIFAWHGPAGEPPGFALPEHPELADPGWVPVERHEWDIPIWEGKRYLERPILCDGDGAIAPFRKWARQFYASAPERSAGGGAQAD